MTLRTRKIMLAVSLLALGVTAQVALYRFFAKAGTVVIIPEKLDSIVRLTRNDKTFCSATIVSPDLAITAAHCVMVESDFGVFMNTDGIEIRARDNKAIGVTAKAIFASPQMDQAMLTGDFRAFVARPIITNPEALTKIKVKGQKFISCGYPLNGDLYCNELTFERNDLFFWAVNGVLLPGMSGGPTMLPDGAVVAVNTAVVQNLSIVSPIYNITKNLPRKK